MAAGALLLLLVVLGLSFLELGLLLLECIGLVVAVWLASRTVLALAVLVAAALVAALLRLPLRLPLLPWLPLAAIAAASAAALAVAVWPGPFAEATTTNYVKELEISLAHLLYILFTLFKIKYGFLPYHDYD